VRNSVQFHKDEILLPGRSIKFFMNAKFGAEPPAGKTAEGYYKRSAGYGPPLFYKAPILTAWSWAAPYLGVNIGYSAGRSKTDALFSDATLGAPLFATGSLDSLKGIIGGVQAGYNWQAGNWVAGLEGDIQMSGQGATPSYVCPSAVCNPTIVDFDAPVTANFVQGHKLDSFGTLRGRLGTTITPDVIAYATGGLAVGSIRTAITLSGVGFDADGNPSAFSAPFSVLKIKPGWTGGAGLEARLFGNVTGKVEYLYLDFGTVSASVTNPLNATPITLATSARITDNTVRAGVNYKFDPAVGGYDVVPGIGVPLIYKAPAYGVPLMTAWSWAGPYLGINVGYSAGKSKTDAAFSDPTGTPLFAAGSSDNLNGVIAGFQGGYNWVTSNWLMTGIETDIQLSTQNTTPTFICPGALCNPAIGDVAPAAAALDRAQKLDWFATVRGRLGAIVTPDTLMYLTGGLAVAAIRIAGTVAGFGSSVDDNGNPVATPVGLAFYDHRTKAGWTAGAGFEAHLSGNLTGKVEYLYLDFGRVSTAATNSLNSTPLAVDFDSRVTDHIVRVGLNYKFDPFGAVYAAAGDSRASMPFKTPMLAAWTWAGPYFGGTIGYSAGRSKTDTIFSAPASGTGPFATRASRRLDGASGGAQAGYNWLAGIWLAGIEGDLNYSGQRAKLNAVCPGETCNPALIGVIGDSSVIANFEDSQKLEWFATLRVRLGVTVTPDAIAYVTGGLAVGEVMTAGTVFGFDGNGNPVNTIVSSHNTKGGWTVGGGIEGRLAGNWTAKIEYLYLDLGMVTTIPAPAPGATTAVAFNSRITDNLLRVGVNYKFDAAGIWTND
jgi:opacity protein-like surface antigen